MPYVNKEERQSSTLEEKMKILREMENGGKPTDLGGILDSQNRLRERFLKI